MKLEQVQAIVLNTIAQIFRGAAELTPIVPTPVARVSAMSQLVGAIYDALRDLNRAAQYIGDDGYAYTDWNEYLSPMDIYYDDDGSLFLLCTKMGKLFRTPVTVSTATSEDDGAIELVTLGTPIEIPLSGRSVTTSVKVIRTADGKRRWLARAASSVLNRIGEIDSTALFDSFIAHAESTKQFPILSFYHKAGVIRFGIADFLARDEYLYIATGIFDDTPTAQAAADGLERATEEWGTSIGYLPTSEPELLRVANANIPVYTTGINTEISIVLEREAAAHFTAISTREVQRLMDKATRDKLALLVGEGNADALAAQDDETNRAIATSGMIARTETPAAEATPATVISAATAPAETIAAQTPVTETPAAVETQARADGTPTVLELPDEMFGALVDAIVAHPAIQQIAGGVTTLTQNFEQWTPRLTALETSAAEARSATETRLAALETDDQTKRAEWLADLPAVPTTRLVLRPREARAVELDANGTPVAPDSTQIASGTLAKFNSKKATQHA